MVYSDSARAIAHLTVTQGLLDPVLALELLETHPNDSPALVKALSMRVSDAALLRAAAPAFGLKFVDLYGSNTGLHLDQRQFQRADLAELKRHSALPLTDDTGNIVVVVPSPTNVDVLDYLRSVYGQVEVRLAASEQILGRLTLASSAAMMGTSDFDTGDRPLEVEVQAPSVATHSPVVVWVDDLLEGAVAQGASDVHLTMRDDQTLSVRVRVDGMLREIPASFAGREAEVLGILMNRARMDGSNYRDPQDGQFSFRVSGRNIDVRAAMLPLVTGPNLVLRILDSYNIRRDLDGMGFTPDQLVDLRRFTRLHQGMTVVSGPTGSGKTTTLYALLRESISPERNTCSIEDPVEYRLAGVNQVQVRGGSRPLTFPQALRSMVRMDPDVILIGEIRDLETARVALDAAITGHLVMTTVHARDAVGAFTRLTEIGVPPYLVAEALTHSVAQRLVRRLHTCKTQRPPTALDRARYQSLGLDLPALVPTALGCDGCSGTGFRGRVAIVEVLTPSEAIRNLVLTGGTHENIVVAARAEGFITMLDHGRDLLSEAITTAEELLRVLESAQ